MKKNLVIYIIILVLIPVFVISIMYKSLDKNNMQNIEERKIILESIVTKKQTTTTKITSVIKPTKKDINIKIKKNDNILELNIEDYIVGVVAGEMPASFELEALKAQAVASRTYALYKLEQNQENYDVVSTVDDQVYITEEEMKTKWKEDYDAYYKKIKQSVEETYGIVMKQNGKLFKSFYFSMSNGYTEDSIQVFGQNNLNSVSSPWDNETLNNFKVETTISKQKLENLLNIKNITTIKIISRDKTNRVSKLSVNEKEFTGVEFRKLLTLRSTDFEIKEDNENYIITTKGYGHGVGMSQYGANGMAKDKKNYQEILTHYYNDIEICEI